MVRAFLSDLGPEIAAYTPLKNKNSASIPSSLAPTTNCDSTSTPIQTKLHFSLDPVLSSRPRRTKQSAKDFDMTGRTIASAASQRVFGNYELLEQMLLHLPLRDLLLSQRINKACFDVVFNSHAIARALFFQPSAGVAEPVAAQCDDSWDDEWTWIRRGNGSQDRILPFLNPFLEM